MVMQNSMGYTNIVDGGNRLPFQLQIVIGGVDRGEVVPLTKLCKSIHSIMLCVYDIQELKPLRIQLQTEQDVSITFVWNKVYEGRKQNVEWKFNLNQKKKNMLLYEHGKTEFMYPWRCGLYHFEVQHNNEVYLGAFRIVPKNFNDEQLTLIQNTVQSLWGSLLLDRGHYKKTFSIFTDLEDQSYMQMIRLLTKIIPAIKKRMVTVEREREVTVLYRYDYSYRKPSAKTERKNERLRSENTGRRWNRRVSTTIESHVHQYVKYKLESLLSLLHKMLLFTEDNVEKLEKALNIGRREKEAIVMIMTAIEKNGSVTERDKQKYRNLQLLKETDMKKTIVKIQEYNVLRTIVKEFATYITYRLHQPIWKNMKIQPQYPTSSLPHPFRQLIKLLNLSERQLHSHTTTFLLVMKPTFLIYEYYVYVSILFILQEIGFSSHIPLLKQIQSYFYLDGLQEGTTVILEHGEKMVKIVYNDLIETHPLIALSKDSHFYNGEDTKKPDIRMDYYERIGDKWNYRSSIIVEVKYSPMYNIFQTIGNTKATEQMYKYWSIKYVEEQDGKRTFQRKAIYEVICVYPGSQVHPKKVESGCGIFLQFYPYLTKQKEVQLVGKKEFITLLTKWLEIEIM